MPEFGTTSAIFTVVHVWNTVCSKPPAVMYYVPKRFSLSTLLGSQSSSHRIWDEINVRWRNRNGLVIRTYIMASSSHPYFVPEYYNQHCVRREKRRRKKRRKSQSRKKNTSSISRYLLFSRFPSRSYGAQLFPTHLLLREKKELLHASSSFVTEANGAPKASEKQLGPLLKWIENDHWPCMR